MYTKEVSVDMLRLSGTLKTPDLEYLMSIFRDDNYCKYYMSSKFATYRHNFNYSRDGYSFWFGCSFNGAIFEKNNHEVVIEYNPNKVPLTDKALDKILFTMFSMSASNIVVKGCDVAFDFKGVKRESVLFDKKRFRRVLEYYEDGGHTSYIGKRGWGSTKIYNKALEQKVPGDWTRVEFTIKLDFELNYYRGLNDFSMSLPDIFQLDYMQIDDIKYRAYAHLVASGLARIDDFGRTIKKRLLEYGHSNSQEVLVSNENKKDVVECIISYLDTLVNRYPVLVNKVLPF